MPAVEKDASTDDYNSLSPDDLSVLKTRLEIFLLQSQISALTPIKKSIIERVYAFILKYIGWISGLIVLIVSIGKPASDYLEARKKAQVISINNSVLKILDSNSVVKESTLLEVSTQPPDVVSPILLFHLNHGRIDPGLVVKIYTRMFELNLQLAKENMSDKVIFHLLGQKDGRDILLAELSEFASKDLEDNFPGAGDDEKEDVKTKILKAYIDIITDKTLGIEKEPILKPVIDSLSQRCSDTNFKKNKICGYFYDNLH